MSKNLRDLNRVRVSKESLAAKLEENLAQHVEQFEEAKEGWKKAVFDAAEAVAAASSLKEIRKRNRELRRELDDEPKSHEGDYRHVMTLISASIDDEFVISARDFTKYWEDDWDWKERFAATTSKYNN